VNESEKRALWKKMREMFTRWQWTEEEQKLFIEVAKTDLEGAKSVVEWDDAHPYIAGYICV